ncbi:MAG: hypothetical protein A2381_16925 [Bdellovibrionales bacterium RIFOXYB1_FULL_37_110]|nr:MAG: hypothetical protein A2181_07930 [Bdellovibrionales bacterium RIFOXYA1_FULL_38_20]OFZ50082.1 MAG: hypothetical protein A2417_18760 [Bdellovibrionales bacterium RIFOXYC1_FULL_37_79]OFZ59988.1 MAG: hypothetical protein A2381_16925 [Bdellovibrionales bacterium RIFOXYB1_FULL_37_110]
MHKLLFIRLVNYLVILPLMLQAFLASFDFPSCIAQPSVGPDSVNMNLELKRYVEKPLLVDELIHTPDGLNALEEMVETSERTGNFGFMRLLTERLVAAESADSYRVINHLIENDHYRYALGDLLVKDDLMPMNKTELAKKALAKVDSPEDVYAFDKFVEATLNKSSTPEEMKLADTILDKVVELKNPYTLDKYLKLRAKLNPVLEAKKDNIYSTLKTLETMKPTKIENEKIDDRIHVVSVADGDEEFEKRKKAIDWDHLKANIEQIDQMRSVPDGVSNMDRVIKYHPEWTEVLENPEKGIRELLAKGDKETLMKIIDVIEDDKFFTVLTTKLGESNTPLRDDLISHVFYVRAQPDYIIKNTFGQTPSAITPQRRRYYQEYADNYLRGGDPQRIRNYVEYVLAQPYTSDMTQIDRLLINAMSASDVELMDLYLKRRLPVVPLQDRIALYDQLLTRASKSPKGWEYFARSVLPNLTGKDDMQIHKKYLDLAFANKDAYACQLYAENVTDKQFKSLRKKAERASLPSFRWDDGGMKMQGLVKKYSSILHGCLLGIFRKKP